MVSRVCLVHYHEIGLKGKNRSKFENQLVRNLQTALSSYPVERVHRICGHIIVNLADQAALESVAEAVAKVPGVAKVSLAFVCDQVEEEYCACALAAMEEVQDYGSFKVHAKRSNTDYPHHSIEINQIVGSRLCAAHPEKQVIMHHPDVTVEVHMVQDKVYVYARAIPGVGGLPVGTAGKVVSLLSSGFDSPVSTWMIGRRGAVVVPVHFSGRPIVVDTSEYLCQDICEQLQPYGFIGRLYVVPVGEFQKKMALETPEAIRIIIYRRLFYKVAERIAEIEGAKALVVGESLGQVASQTLENIAATNDVVDMPILRPLIGSDKTEIMDRAQRIGTYEICKQPAPDCCTLFMPRRPETKAQLKQIRQVWEKNGYDQLVDEVLEGIEYIDFKGCNSYKPPRAYWRRHETLSPAADDEDLES